MDWLTFKFCVLIWMLCVLKSQSQLLNSTSISTNNHLRPSCLEGRSVFPPNPCNTCICFSGRVYCTNHPCPEKECVNGMELPKPDECNKCICRRGKVTCTNMICIPAPFCTEDQLYPAQNKCNACMCKNGFISCTSNVCIEGPTTTTNTTIKQKKKKICEEGSRLLAPDQCLDCICQNGRKRCKNVCIPIAESRFQDPECYPGKEIARPDDCNNCICFEGQIHCTHLPCHIDTRIGPQCTDDQPVYRLDECNECYCIEGRLECSDLVCIRGSKCVVGQVIPKPDSCNSCKCVEGHIVCTNHQCSVNLRNALLTEPSPTELMPLEECQKGDYIPPPPPPNDCNTCYCMDNHIVCTMINCEGTIPEFKARLKEKNEKTNLEKFDKKIPVEPFITILYKNNDKVPHKLIHSHTYNGFHQEIKVHASHLPKDPTKLLNVLANSLDDAALASISQKIMTSNSASNNQDSKKPFDHSVDQTNQLGEGNVLSAQSSKLITSGSQSNETILVFPHKKPFDDPDSQSLLPLDSKHETAWKTVSTPDTLVYNNGIQILPRHSQEENGNHYYDNLPSRITPVDPNPMIVTRNAAKFGRPGQHYDLPTNPARESADVPSIPTQSMYPTLHPKPININDGKMIYAPLSQINKQIKPAPSSFAGNRDELPHLRPFQTTKPGPYNIYNHNSPTPVFRPEQYELNPDNIVGQQKPSKYHFTANPSNFYPNQGTPQQVQSKPIRIPSPLAYYYKNKSVPLPAKFLNKPNQPIASANQYKQPQFGLKAAPASSYPNNIHLNPAPANLPYPMNRISTIDNEAPQFKSNSKTHHSDILNPSQNEVKPKHKQPNSPQSQLILYPSINYKNEYEAPKIIEENPDRDQLTPNSIISYKYTEDYDPLHTPSESGYEKLPHKVRNKTHSLYEKHTSVAYVSEYDPNDPDDSTPVDHDLNQQHNGPLKYAYLSDEDSQEFDLNEKVDYYLNIPYLQVDQKEPHPKSIQSYLTPPGQRQNDTLYLTMPEMNKYDQHDSWIITNKQFEEYPLSASQNKQTDIKTNQKETQSVLPINFAIYLHKRFKPKLVSPQDNSEKEDSEDPTHLKSNDHQPAPSQTGPPQNQHTPGVFDDQGPNNGFQYSHNAYELPPPKLETPPNHQLPGMFDERGPADGIQNPFNLAEDFTYPKVKLNKSPHFDPFKSMLNDQQPKDNQHISLYSQFGPTQNQHKPGDNHGLEDGFQYAHNDIEDHRQLKPFYNLPSFPPVTTPNKQTPGMFDDRGSLDGFRHPSYLAENTIHSRGNLHNFPPNQFGPDEKRLPDVFDDYGSADGFHYPSKSADISVVPKDKQNDLFIIYEPTGNQHVPWIIEDRGSASGLQNPPSLTEYSSFPKGNIHTIYPSHSADNPLQPKGNQQNPSYPQLGLNQNQHMPGVFDDRGSADGLQYPSHAAEKPLQPKGNQQNLSHPQSGPNQNQHKPEVFDDRGSTDGFQYPSDSAENPLQPKGNQQNPSYPQLVSNQNQHMPEVFDDRGSTDGFQYPSDSAENPLQPKGNQQNPSHPQLVSNQNQHMPGVFDDRGSPDGFRHPSYLAENTIHSRGNLHNFPPNQFGPDEKRLPGVFDDYGSADGFHYPSKSADISVVPKEKQNDLFIKYEPTGNQHVPWIIEDRGSASGLQNPPSLTEYSSFPKSNIHTIYPSHSADNPLQPKGNQQNPPYPQLGLNQNQHMPGVFDDRGSADGLQYPSHAAENPLQPKGNQQNPSHPQSGPNQNQHMPGVFDDRGSADGLQYPSDSAENPLQPKDSCQNPSHSQLGPNQHQHMPGVFDYHGSADGFQYPSHSAENPLRPKGNQQNPSHPQLGPNQNQHIPGVFDDRGSVDGFQYPSHSAENPLQPKGNHQNPSHTQLGPNQNQNMPGVFGDRGTADGFQYPSGSAENPLQPKGNQQNPSHPQLGPNQNQNMPGVFGDRGTADGFQYPSDSAENPLQPKGNQQNPSHPQIGPNQNQHMPGVFGDRGTADGFQYPSDSAENSLQPKGNQQNPSHPQLGPNQNQNMPGVFGDRGTADGLQYPSDSAENPLQPKGNHQNPSHTQLGPNQNQNMPGVFDDRGSADGFQYPSDSAKNPLQPKGNQQNPSHPQLGPNQNQNMPGVFGDRGTADGLQYPSDSAENPLQPKGNQQNPSHPQLGPNQNQNMPGVFDDRGTADGFQYPSDSAENPLQPKGNQQNPSHPQIGPNQNQHMPGVFDDRGFADGFQYPSHSAENPLQPKGNQQNSSHPQLGPNQNQHMPEPFDDRGSATGFQYPSHAAENPLQPKGNQQNPSHPQLGPNQNQHIPGVFDDRGSADGFQYPSHSAENSLQPKGNQQNSSHPQLGPIQNQHMPGVFDNRASADGFQYPSHAVENPLQPKGNEQNPSHPQLGPNQNQHIPGVFDDRASADGFQYPSHSAENPLQPKGNEQNPSHPQLVPNQHQHMPGVFDDHGSADGFHYPSDSAEDPKHPKDNPDTTPESNSSTRPPRFEPDYDQYKPSSFDNLFNGIHHMPRPVPNQDNNALGFNAKLTTPRSEFKPELDQYQNIDLFDEDDGYLQIEIDNSTDLINSDSMQNNPYHGIKPDNVLDSLLPTDGGNFPDYYNELYPLFLALKKLSEPSNDGLSSMDKLDLLPILFPEITDILNYNPSKEQDDEAPVENQVTPLKKLKSKLNQLTDNDNRILNWLKSKLKLFPTKDNTTETKNEVGLPKIFSLLSKLISNKIKKSKENITFNGFDPEIVKKIMNDFKEDTQTVTPIPRSTETTNTIDNRFQSIPTVLEETQQQDTKKYPEVHIILNQPDDEDNVDLPPYTKADDEAGLATDMGSKEVHSPLFPNILHPRFKHRPKDQKEECGDRTHWISNCHRCFCYFGQAMCLRMQDCKLRPFGEPMICKPYSHFKMGCYTCECNGDGVTECDATDCGKEPKGKRQVSGSRELALPIYHEFFDDKNTNESLQYYKFYKKLPKDCPRQNSQIEYPTCERGTSWISSCHKCECNERGKHECAKINDCVLNFDSYGKPGRCKPNTKFYPKTNSMPCVECLCNDEGIPSCPEADVKKH